MKFFYSYFLLVGWRVRTLHQQSAMFFFSLRSFREVSFKTLFAGTSGILVLFIHLYILFWLVEGGLSCKLQGSIHHY